MKAKTFDEFVELTKQVRDRQKSYFKTHSDIDLKKSKEAEKDLDKAIKDYEEAKKPQLF